MSAEVGKRKSWIQSDFSEVSWVMKTLYFRRQSRPNDFPNLTYRQICLYILPSDYTSSCNWKLEVALKDLGRKGCFPSLSGASQHLEIPKIMHKTMRKACSIRTRKGLWSSFMPPSKPLHFLQNEFWLKMSVWIVMEEPSFVCNDPDCFQ